MGGERAAWGFMLAGSDPVGLDVVGLKLLQKVDPRLVGKSLRDITYLRYAIDLGLGDPRAEVESW